MNEFLQNVLYVVITTLVPILVGYGISYLKAKRAEKLQNVDNTYVKETITQATDIIMNVVDTVTQTLVDDLKKQGKFDVEQQKLALQKALETSKDMLSTEAAELVVEKYNDLDTWIRNTIEAYIHSTKVTK
jgi:hypothetical protein